MDFKKVTVDYLYRKKQFIIYPLMHKLNSTFAVLVTFLVISSWPINLRQWNRFLCRILGLLLFSLLFSLVSLCFFLCFMCLFPGLARPPLSTWVISEILSTFPSTDNTDFMYAFTLHMAIVAAVHGCRFGYRQKWHVSTNGSWSVP